MRDYLIYSKDVGNGNLKFLGQVKSNSKENALAKYFKDNNKVKYPVVISRNTVIEGSMWR